MPRKSDYWDGMRLWESKLMHKVRSEIDTLRLGLPQNGARRRAVERADQLTWARDYFSALVELQRVPPTERLKQSLREHWEGLERLLSELHRGPRSLNPLGRLVPVADVLEALEKEGVDKSAVEGIKLRLGCGILPD